MQTLRTQLRRLQTSDFELMRMLDSDPDIVRFTPMGVPQSDEQTRDRIKSQMEKQPGLEPFGVWLAGEKQTGNFIGWFMLLPIAKKELELGFMVIQTQWGNGFATEVSRALIDFAKTKSISQIVARTSLDNFASIRVLEKLRFRYSKNIFVTERSANKKVELKFFELQMS